jgi:hypothetical protein
MKYKHPTTFREADGIMHSEHGGWEPIPYLKYLGTIDFENNLDLLKFFGKSFFHDANIKSVKVNKKDENIVIEIVRENDLEDINHNFSKSKQHAISKKQYFKNPIIYQCFFQSVSTLNQASLVNKDILDTELRLNKQKKILELFISLSDLTIVKIEVLKCKVKLVNMEIYGLKKIPYCKVCKSNLLSRLSLERIPESREYR